MVRFQTHNLRRLSDILPTRKRGASGFKTSNALLNSALHRLSLRANVLAQKTLVLAVQVFQVLRNGLPATAANLKLLSCAVLDFFRYHPITGLSSDCPVELKGVYLENLLFGYCRAALYPRT